MNDRHARVSRRKFLAQASALSLTPGLKGEERKEKSADNFRSRPPKPTKTGRKPLAVVCTVYRDMSHAYHIAGRFIQGYVRGGQYHVPTHYVESLYVDQIPGNDLSRSVAREFNIRHTRSIEEALTLGTNKLAVDGILLIGEHGNYPRNEKGQILYPRFEMMEKVVEVFRRTGQTVPVFCDKHLSYSAEKGQKMVAWAREMNFPLQAGSSLPVTWRRPEIEIPFGSSVKSALVAGYGPVEVYGFHGLEALQAMVERRDRGETGVKAVTCLTGEDVWKAGDAGLWDWKLLEAALGRSETLCPGDVRQNVGRRAIQDMPATPATALLVEYRSGLSGTLLLLNGHVADFCFAAKVANEKNPLSCLFLLPPPPGAKYFDCLVSFIEKLFQNKKSSYPVERTLLTGGILDAAMESKFRKGVRVETPGLPIRYTAAQESLFIRGSVSAPT